MILLNYTKNNLEKQSKTIISIKPLKHCVELMGKISRNNFHSKITKKSVLLTYTNRVRTTFAGNAHGGGSDHWLPMSSLFNCILWAEGHSSAVAATGGQILQRPILLNLCRESRLEAIAVTGVVAATGRQILQRSQGCFSLSEKYRLQAEVHHGTVTLIEGQFMEDWQRMASSAA